MKEFVLFKVVEAEGTTNQIIALETIYRIIECDDHMIVSINVDGDFSHICVEKFTRPLEEVFRCYEETGYFRPYQRDIREDWGTLAPD